MAGKEISPSSGLTPMSCILEGTQTREARGEATTTATSGGFIYDGPMQIHRTENTARVKLLIVRVLDKGKPSTIRAE